MSYDDKKIINGIYAVLSPHFINNDVVFVPKHMKTINNNEIKDGMNILVWRFPVLAKKNILKLKVKTYDENVIKIPLKYINHLDGDFDGDCVCAVVLDNDIYWNDKQYENFNYSKSNTDINLNSSFLQNSKRCSKIYDIIMSKNLDMWLKLYCDGVKRIELNETLPSLPGTLYKRIIDKHVDNFTTDEIYIYHNGKEIADYENEYNKTDIWITAVQEVVGIFYQNTVKMKHPNINIDINDIYALYNYILRDDDLKYFEELFGIKYVVNGRIMNKKYFYEKYFNTNYLRSCFDVVYYGCGIK